MSKPTKGQALEIKHELEGRKIKFRHKKGSATAEQFKNKEKIGTVVGVDVEQLREGIHFPIKVKLEDGCVTYIDVDEILAIVS